LVGFPHDFLKQAEHVMLRTFGFDFVSIDYRNVLNEDGTDSGNDTETFDKLVTAAQ